MTARRPSGRALAVLVVVSVVVAGLAPVGADVSGVPSEPTARQDDSLVVDREVPRFVDPPYREHRGDVVRVPVAVPFGGTATVTLRGNDTGYAASVTLHDGNADGRVTLVWNTYVAGDGVDRAFRVAAPGDAAANRSASPVDGAAPAGEYRLAAGRGANRTAANVTDATTLRLRRPGPVGLTVLRADPAVAARLTDPGDVAAANATSDLAGTYADESVLLDERSLPVVARGEAVVLALRAPGLAGAVVAGSNASAGFRALLGDGLAVRLREHVGTVDASELGFAYDLRNASGVRVVPDPGNDTYYLVLGMPSAVLRAGPDAVADGVELGDVFRFAATVQSARQSPTRAETAVQVFENDTAAFDDGRADRLSLPAANATVGGRTTLRPGERVTVRLESPAGDPFPVERTVEVDSRGRFEASLDLSGVSTGTRFRAVVRHGGRTTQSVPGVVARVARVRIADRRAVRLDDRVAVDRVSTTDGGFVVVRRGSLDGEVLGVRHLRPGNHSDVVVPFDSQVDGPATLVVAVRRDADGDRALDEGDPLYAAGSPTDVARLGEGATPATRGPSPRAGSATATSTAPPATSTPATPQVSSFPPSPNAAGSPPGTEPPDAGSIPGPPGAVVVVALVAAIAAARMTRFRRGGDGA